VRATPRRRGIDCWYFGSPRRHSRHSCGSPENAPWWDGPRDQAVPALAAEGAARDPASARCDRRCDQADEPHAAPQAPGSACPM